MIPTVGAILKSTETSVRLGNCVANNREVFESWLIENAIEERENFIGDIRSRCASLGRKTADEALEILERYAVSPWPLGATEEGEQAEEQGPSAPFLSKSIVSVLARHEMSTRLENVVKAGALDGTTMRDVVSDPYSVKKLFLELKNSGRKTADEAMGILFNYAERMNVSQETPDSPATMTCREFFQSGPHVNIPARKSIRRFSRGIVAQNRGWRGGREAVALADGFAPGMGGGDDWFLPSRREGKASSYREVWAERRDQKYASRNCD